MSSFIAVDIGGTFIKGGVADSAGNIRHVLKRPTESGVGFTRIKENLYAVIDALIGIEKAPSAIAVSSAGTINAETGTVIYATENLPGWTGYGIKADLEQRYGRPVFAINDGHAALLGEQYCGAAKDCPDCVMLTFGTGIGGAVISDGALLNGSNYGAGRLGHLILHPGGRECTCGGRGCAEQYLSASALLKEAAGQGVGTTLEEFFSNTLKKEQAARILNDFTVNLQYLIQNITGAFDPGLIILGGGLVYFKEFWLPPVRKLANNVIMKIAELENDAGMIGAAVFAMRNLERKDY